MALVREVARSGDRSIDGMLFGFAWDLNSISYVDPRRRSDYGFRYDLDYDGDGIPAHRERFAPLTADQLLWVRSALDNDHRGAVPALAGFAVEGFTLQEFHEVARPAGAILRFGNSMDAGRTAYGLAPGFSYGGEVWFGRTGRFPEPGNHDSATILHEIGHALGLKHPHDPEYFGRLPFEVDSTEFSVMSYRSFVGAPPRAGYQSEPFGFPQSFMMLDIAALQHLYGANFAVNAGNTVYSWSPFGGETWVNGKVALPAVANLIFATVWDGGGTDTYDLSEYCWDLRLDLRPGQASIFSDSQRAFLGGGPNWGLARGNIFNALQHEGDPRSLIENAVGGSGDDRILGNAADNLLRGGRGEDALRGLQGEDRLCGGPGGDTFLFRILADSRGDAHDTIVAGDGAKAFLAPGRMGGDLIDLGEIDADAGAAGNQAFAFRGGREAGHLWLEDRGPVTWVYGNTDGDRAVEFALAIRDGGAGADDYTRHDFVL
jgi:serralysin